MKWMIPYLLLSTLPIVTFSAYQQQDDIPKAYTLLKEVYGDLDKDSVDEKVVVYNMNNDTTNEEGAEYHTDRNMIIYKETKTSWRIWKRSTQAIMNSGDGGMMGDPFSSLEIKNGILEIVHFGGSRTKWNFTDKYRFQHSEFALIGIPSFSGDPCDFWEKIEYNISTGKIIYSYEEEDCDEEKVKIVNSKKETFYHKLKKKPLLQNRTEGNIKIFSPKYKIELLVL